MNGCKKTVKGHVVTTRLEGETYARARRRAAIAGVTIGALTRELVEAALDERSVHTHATITTPAAAITRSA